VENTRLARHSTSRRLTPGDLRCLVRRVLAEDLEDLPPPDEPGVKPGQALGQYLMPRDRTDPAYDRVEERDTPLEDEFVRALGDHYRRNNSNNLVKVWTKIWKVAQSGLYSKWLQPPAGSTVYRAIGGLTPDAAAKVTGLTVQDILEEPGVAHRVVGSPPTLRPSSKVSSWTLEPTVENVQEFGTSAAEPGQCAVLFAAKCEPGGAGGGQFLMNPNSFTSDFHLAEQYREESEVIAYGPIEIEELSYIYYDEGSPERFERRSARQFKDMWLEGAQSLLAVLGL
jgi:hypothetical protein